MEKRSILMNATKSLNARARAAFLLPCVALLLAAALSGCAYTPNLADMHSSFCSIHGCQMEVRELPVAQVPPGSPAEMMEFSSTRGAHFPHYDGVRVSEDVQGYVFSKKVRDYVCAKCTAEYRLWLADHPKWK